MLGGTGGLPVPALAAELGEGKAQGEQLGWIDTAGSAPTVPPGRASEGWMVPRLSLGSEGQDAARECSWEVGWSLGRCCWQGGGA